MTELPLIGNRYQVRGVLGKGGMGEVLLARDLRLDTDVAIKRIPAHLAQDPAMKAALTREAQILARLNDPRIVRLFDLADTPDGLLLVLEYVCGPSLQDLLAARGRLTESELVHVMRDVTGGLAVAHAHGIVHRDLKPANILMAVSPEALPAFLAARTLPADIATLNSKVADFGIAKVTGRHTGSATLFSNAGSPDYMAPEQFRGEPPSAETDIYALGIIAYEALTGGPPFPSGDLSYLHVWVDPPPPPGCSALATAVVMRALAKRREDRYPTAIAFFAALAGQAGPAAAPSPPPAMPPLPPKPAEPMPRPGRDASEWYVLFVGALVCVLLAGALWLWWRTVHQRGGDTADSATSIAAPPLAVESRLQGIAQAPYIEELPPIVEQARNPITPDPASVIGPRQPRVAWKARVALPDTIRFRVAAVGPEGIVYTVAGTLDGDMVCGMRDGKLVWCHNGLPSYNDLELAPDGRAWLSHSFTDPAGAVFCFNSRGQGGRVPAKLRPPPHPPAPFANTLGTQWGAGGPRTVGGGYYCSSNGHALDNAPPRPGLLGRAWDGGDAWFLPLPHDCAETHPTVDEAGAAYFVTVANALYHVDPHGRVRWSATPPCPVKQLFPLPSGDLVAMCSGALARFHTGALAWKTPVGDAIKGAPLIDRAETFYLLAESKSSVGRPGHVVAIDSSGARRWDLSLANFGVDRLFLDGAGRLYVTGEVVGNSTNGSWGILCFVTGS